MKWISVKEKTPPPNEEVLTYDKSKHIIIQSFEYILSEEKEMRAYFSAHDAWVTHWMPLPTPPEDNSKPFTREDQPYDAFTPFPKELND